MARALRLSVSAVAAYLIALKVVADPRPVTAALTALLIVQVTLVGTLAEMARRIVSVVLGVAIAIGVASFAGFTWWSLGALVAASILTGQLLRLGPHLYEVPISAMLVLAAGGAGVQATDRVIETVVGAAVGLLLNVIVPPNPHTRDAGVAVQRFAEDLAQLLGRVGQAILDRPPSGEEARGWLQELRQVGGQIAQVDRAVNETSQSRRLNPRAVGTTDPTPDLRSGVDVLEHSTVALRSVFRSIADGAGPSNASDPSRAEVGDEDFRAAIATLMFDIASAITGFGALVRAEAQGSGEAHPIELHQAVDAVGEARARLTELLLVDPHDAVGLWQLHGALLAGVDRVLAELDLEEHARRRDRRRVQALAGRGPAAQAAQRLRSTTRRAITDKPVLRKPRRRSDR